MKCLFIAIPRTASASIRAALGAGDTPRAVNLREDPRGTRFDPERKTITFLHSPIPLVVKAGIITPEWLAERFVFTFIRNPWDRMVSLYHRVGQHCEDPTFSGCVEHIITNPPDPVGLDNWNGLVQANPQAAWLENVQIDFLGRFEQLEKDWHTVSGRLGIDYPLPHLHKSQRSDYREYYTPDLAKRVGRFYAEDVELGGYRFD